MFGKRQKHEPLPTDENVDNDSDSENNDPVYLTAEVCEINNDDVAEVCEINNDDVMDEENLKRNSTSKTKIRLILSVSVTIGFVCVLVVVVLTVGGMKKDHQGIHEIINSTNRTLMPIIIDRGQIVISPPITPTIADLIMKTPSPSIAPNMLFHNKSTSAELNTPYIATFSPTILPTSEPQSEAESEIILPTSYPTTSPKFTAVASELNRTNTPFEKKSNPDAYKREKRIYNSSDSTV